MEMFQEHSSISFTTATILWWKNLLKPDKYKDVIVDSLAFLSARERATIYGFVIMPNHIHLLWTISQNWRLKDVQRDFMKFTGQMIKFDLAESHPEVLKVFYVGLKDRQYQFWERNSKTKFLTSRKVVEQKLDYIHNNPVQGKWGLVSDPIDYKFSSIRFYEQGSSEYAYLRHYMEFFDGIEP